MKSLKLIVPSLCVLLLASCGITLSVDDCKDKLTEAGYTVYMEYKTKEE